MYYLYFLINFYICTDPENVGFTQYNPLFHQEKILSATTRQSLPGD
jgi:hypothetical protein